MIFLRFNTTVVKYQNFPMFACSNLHPDLLRYDIKASADVIFEFKDGKTVYYKNRFLPTNEPQYSDEEQLVIRLKSVLI